MIAFNECTMRIFLYNYTLTRITREATPFSTHIIIQSRSAPLLCHVIFRRRVDVITKLASTTVVFFFNAIICHGVSRKSGTAMAVVAVAVPRPLHFPSGNIELSPVSTVGKGFVSPIKKGVQVGRAKRSCVPLALMVGKQLLTDIDAHELPNEVGLPQSSAEVVVVNIALLARIEALEAENALLKSEPQKVHFRLKDIEHGDNLVRFSTGFVSYTVFIAFEFLGPIVNHMNYWDPKRICKRQRKRKLDPKKQLFLTSVKLKLNLKLKDLGFRLGLSMSQVSWDIYVYNNLICFLYHH